MIEILCPIAYHAYYDIQEKSYNIPILQSFKCTLQQPMQETKI